MPQQEPPPDPAQMAIQGQMAIEKMKIDAGKEKIAMQAELDKLKADAQLQQEQLRSANDVAIEQEKIAAQMELERWKAELQAQVDLQKEQMRVQAQQQMKQMEYTTAKPMPISLSTPESEGVMNALSVLLEEQKKANEELVKTLTKPKRIVRDDKGRALGVE